MWVTWSSSMGRLLLREADLSAEMALLIYYEALRPLERTTTTLEDFDFFLVRRARSNVPCDEMVCFLCWRIVHKFFCVGGDVDGINAIRLRGIFRVFWSRTPV